ncbi:hypothetical protein, partial [Rathayibacter iranicus]|uniref:hypothetical protein n=1 Tax=Rathayibacter iranicus TaxID=59737 RepID=UPI001F3046ED
GAWRHRGERTLRVATLVDAVSSASRPSSGRRRETGAGQAVQVPETRKRFVRLACVMVGSSRQWV